MAAKKSFKDAAKSYSNPANAYLTSAPKDDVVGTEEPRAVSVEIVEDVEPTPMLITSTPTTAEPPARGQWTHRAQHVEGSESYTKRVQLLMRPSTHARAKKAAADQGLSLNNFINGLLEDYLDQEGTEA